jgi:hypothetical protein
LGEQSLKLGPLVLIELIDERCLFEHALTQLGNDRASLSGHDQPPNAPISRVDLSFQEPSVFDRVDDGRDI